MTADYPDTTESNRELRELLIDAYVDELETIVNYMGIAINLDTFDGHDIADELLADIQEELTHAEQLGNRIRVLNGTVPLSLDEAFVLNQDGINSTTGGNDIVGVIDGVIESENKAIETYTEIASLAQEVGDHGTYQLASSLLSDEEAHRQEFRSLRQGLE